MERSCSPTPSRVSMKSDLSKGGLINFKEAESSNESTSGQMERSCSPTPSCVSMKSDLSKGGLINFKEAESSNESTSGQMERSCSTTPSCVSMKSDLSKGGLINFNEAESSNESTSGQMERSCSPTPSCVSMKSDLSKGDLINFKEAESSNERNEVEVSQQISLMKTHLQTEFKYLIEGSTKQKHPTPLSTIFTELFIIKEGRGGVNVEHEVRRIERTFLRKSAEGRPVKCHDLFSPLTGQDKPIRKVLTKGVAGIGKTVCVQKFILDWADGKACDGVHFIFPLPFRELNLMKEEKVSLVDLIHHFFPKMYPLNIFRNSEYTVMFIFDGLDESRLPLDFHSNPKCCEVTELASVDVLLTNLIKGNLLPASLLWITSRPTAANQIPFECVDQVTEIRGFIDQQKEDYFRKKIRNENLASRTIANLKSSRSLYIMCHIPVFCWISATVVEKTSDGSEEVNMPRTLTQMYTYFLNIQTSINKGKYADREDTDEDIIFSLGKLAFQQLEKGNLIFYEEDLRECGIDVTKASVYSGVCTQIFREESGLYKGTVFSFVHLSIQEFLAALYVFLCFSNKQIYKHDDQQSSELSALFRAITLFELHKTAVDLALLRKNGHLDLFLRFLLGLSLESNQILLKDLQPKTRSQAQNSEQTVHYLKRKIRDQKNSDKVVNLFYCLNELNHHAVVEDTERSPGILSVVMLLPGQWETMKFEFRTSEEQLNKFDLQKYIKTPEKDLTELLSPEDVLQRLLPVVTSALLRNCNLTRRSCPYLSSALTQPSKSLRHLELSCNKLQDSGVELLCSGLSHHNCKLEHLQLHECGLKEKSCSYLASALTSHSSSLKQLDLSSNKLLDSGVKFLSHALCHQNCKLEELLLLDCRLKEESCSYLTPVLTSPSSSLRQLKLSNNRLMDSGVDVLCSALKTCQNCKLEELELINCDLTEKSCFVLASVISSHSSNLRQLDLSHNYLLDSGVKCLSDSLCQQNCKLQKLGLRSCYLEENSCSYLATVLTSHLSSLRQLDLSDNKQLKSGVECLCSSLCHENCKLEKLHLSNCNLTEKTCSYLASALTPQSSLRHLQLTGNKLMDSGVKLLCSTLVKGNGKLEELQLDDCNLTEESCSCLVSALTSHSSNLTQLKLSYNKLQDSGVKVLCLALCNQNCKLEELQLSYCELTKEGCCYLASALTSPSSSLTQLELSVNGLSASDVEQLSILVKDPQCKLEKLDW